ncbi:MAG: TIGR03790 family protein [Deltaproteobacteria bacterium]|nr:TIGR03790 family protein [Deltaproteobacteria bacterium]
MSRTMLLMVAAGMLAAGAAVAGGGPANVLVLYNADDTDAAAVAEYYRDARSIPDGQMCGITGIDPSSRTIDFDDYHTLVHVPLDACLAGLPQPEEIDYIVIVRGLPYRVNIPSGFYTSLQAMIQIHHAASVGTGDELAGTPQYYDSYYQASIINPHFQAGSIRSGDYTLSNPYMNWYNAATRITRLEDQVESFRRQSAGAYGGYDFAGNLFVVTRLDGFDHDDARDLVDRAVAADESFPAAEILCMEGSDSARAARDPECEYVVRHLDMAGITATYLAPFDGSLAGHTVSAYWTGTASLRGAIAGQTYVPGAIACNLTSTGAAPTNFFCSSDGTTCPASESQTSIARFIRAGATGAHGAVAEPLNNTFPNAGTLLLYTFGYNLGESYFFNQRFLYWQNILLGDPLTTPYAERPVVTVVTDGTHPQDSPLVVEGAHPDGVARVLLYIDEVLVAREDSDTLSHVVTDVDGSELEILAVAIAQNVGVTRTGWPNPDQNPQADVQGWTTTTVTVTAPVEPDEVEVADLPPDADDDVEEDALVDADDDPAVDPGGEEPEDGGSETSGCGCVLVG